MMKKLKWILIALFALLAVIQFFRPKMSNPAVDEQRTIQAMTAMPANVSAVLERSCNDCHSSKTSWPWYSRVAPVSWLVANDVNEGRRHLSFSDWASYDDRRATRKLGEMCDEVREGNMPLKSYTWIHPQSKLSEEDKKLICDWTETRRSGSPSSTASKN
jgi:Haem-binding domain